MCKYFGSQSESISSIIVKSLVTSIHLLPPKQTFFLGKKITFMTLFWLCKIQVWIFAPKLKKMQTKNCDIFEFSHTKKAKKNSLKHDKEKSLMKRYTKTYTLKIRSILTKGCEKKAHFRSFLGFEEQLWNIAQIS